MKKYMFKDGAIVEASCKEDAIKQHKVKAAFPFEKKGEEKEEYLLVPVDKIVNKGWLLRFKKLLIIGENTIGIKTGLRKEKLARTLPKMNKLIHEEA